MSAKTPGNGLPAPGRVGQKPEKARAPRLTKPQPQPRGNHNARPTSPTSPTTPPNPSKAPKAIEGLGEVMMEEAPEEDLYSTPQNASKRQLSPATPTPRVRFSRTRTNYWLYLGPEGL